MFSSSGNFRGLNCPFYALGSGTCRRPYCHFRHVRNHAETGWPQPSRPKGSIDEVYPQTADVGNYVFTSQPPAVLSVTQDTSKDTPVQYVPTPIAQIALARRRHKMAARTSRKEGKKLSAPTYIPTPLSQIVAPPESGVSQNSQTEKVEGDDAEYDPVKTTLSDTSLKSEKYSMDNDFPAGEDEYDPLENDCVLTTSKQRTTSLCGSLLECHPPSATSSKYSLQAHSKSVSDLEYDPVDDSTCSENSPHSSTRESTDEQLSKSASTIAKEVAKVKPMEEDGLYDLADPAADADDDPMNGVDEYDPLHNDQNLLSRVNASYTPTNIYSISDVHSKPSKESEYDPFSTFSSEQELEEHKTTKKRKDLSPFDDQSSDCEALMIADETEKHEIAPSPDEEPALKKQKYTEDRHPCSNALAGGRSSEEEACNAWVNDIAQESFLADVSFHPPPESETNLTPSYSYNPAEAQQEEGCDSGVQEWNPTEYLTQLSSRKTIEPNSKDGKKSDAPSKAKASKVRKVNGAQGLKARSGKVKPSSSSKKQMTSKEAVGTSQHEESASGKKNDSKNTLPSNVKNTFQTNDKQREIDKDNKKCVSKPEEMVRAKVSADQLSKFFCKMYESKTKKGKLNINTQKSTPMAKQASKQRKSMTSSGSKSISESLIENHDRNRQDLSRCENEHGMNNVTEPQKPREDHVIVIDSSSSSEDNATKQPPNMQINDPLQDKKVESLSNKMKPSKTCDRKTSNKLLFGDDSDSDNSDVQIVKKSEDEIVLVSDGYSSTEKKQKGNRPRQWDTDKEGDSTLNSKQLGNESFGQKNTNSTQKCVKLDKSKESSQKQRSKYKSVESHTRSGGCGKRVNDRGKMAGKDQAIDSSTRKIKSSVVRQSGPPLPCSPTRVLNAVMKCDDSDGNIADDNDSDHEVDSNCSCDNEDTVLSDFNDTDLSFSESDTFEECLRIFQEDNLNRPVQEPQKLQRFTELEQPRKEDIVLSTGKQRVAHVSKFHSSKHKNCTPRPKARPNPRQVCHNRYVQAQQHLQEQLQHQDRHKQPASEASAAGNTAVAGSKKRTAHVPALQSRQNLPCRSASSPVTGINAKIQLKYSIGHSASTDATGKTVAITAPKGERRIAHLPKKVNPRPIIPPDSTSKVPSNIRQRYLNLFIDEFLKTTGTEQDAFEQGLTEEKVVYERATSRNIYLNLSVNTLKRLRSAQTPGQSKVTSPTTSKASISHEAVIGGKPATQHTYTLNRSHNRLAAHEEKYEGAFLYQRLKPYLLSEEELVDNGYPRPTETAGLAMVKGEDTKKCTPTDPNQHICSRCGKTFLRRPDGHYITRENCTYHWGKFWHGKVGGSIEGRFNCCSGASDAKGCCIAKYHVTEDKTNNLRGFMKTVVKSPPADGNPGMYALDCEMCYTVKALELTRVTVIDDKLTCVYDTLVKPSAEVVDYNTRFSGITEDDLKCVTTTLQDVQAVLLNMFSSDSILIGHSLESDMLALKMIHSTVIDTAVLFPHRRGLPFKRALRTLMAEYLNRIIQNDVGGHDSKEDAKSCMELLIWKAKQDTKKIKS